MAAVVENLRQRIKNKEASFTAEGQAPQTNADQVNNIDTLETMIQLSALMNSSLEVSDVRTRAIESATALVNCETCSLLFVNDETGGLYFDVALGVSGEKLKTIELKKGEGIAGWVAEHKQPLIIQDAQNDPRLFRKADKTSGFTTNNMCCVPITNKRGTLGVLQALNKRGTHFSKTDARLLIALANQIAVALENVRLYDQLKNSLSSVVSVLADVIEKRDPFATGHAKRVANYSIQIGKAMGMTKAQLVNLKIGAMLHDVGMIGVPDNIAQKKTRLTEEEHNELMRHVDIGLDILESVKHLNHIRPVIKYHHERWDGTGPYRLKEKQIPLEARIVALADHFDALTSERPYTLTKGYDAAIECLKSGAGKEFDPDVVEAFFNCKADMSARRHPLVSRR
ncbi:MAG: HD domain-containing protein [Gammaproteobacteria bacterium]|nr:HD domain-containing protein [Gammaproteobacteria bacterium]MDH5731015.1 HD domain-containing protein [Gammaproteobacteria bacterium]